MSGEFKKLSKTQRIEAAARLTAALKGDGYEPSVDRGSTLSFVKDTSQLVERTGVFLRRMSVLTRITLPLPVFGTLNESIGFEPDATSVIRVIAPCHAFTKTSPAGKSSCVGGVETRELPLGQAGLSERTFVTGRVVHPWLRHPQLSWFVGVGTDDIIEFFLGIGLLVLVALKADAIKRIASWIAARAAPPPPPPPAPAAGAHPAGPRRRRKNPHR